MKCDSISEILFALARENRSTPSVDIERKCTQQKVIGQQENCENFHPPSELSCVFSENNQMK